MYVCKKYVLCLAGRFALYSPSLKFCLSILGNLLNHSTLSCQCCFKGTWKDEEKRITALLSLYVIWLPFFGLSVHSDRWMALLNLVPLKVSTMTAFHELQGSSGCSHFNLYPFWLCQTRSQVAHSQSHTGFWVFFLFFFSFWGATILSLFYQD